MSFLACVCSICRSAMLPALQHDLPGMLVRSAPTGPPLPVAVVPARCYGPAARNLRLSKATLTIAKIS